MFDFLQEDYPNQLIEVRNQNRINFLTIATPSIWNNAQYIINNDIPRRNRRFLTNKHVFFLNEFLILEKYIFETFGNPYSFSVYVNNVKICTYLELLKEVYKYFPNKISYFNVHTLKELPEKSSIDSEEEIHTKVANLNEQLRIAKQKEEEIPNELSELDLKEEDFLEFTEDNNINKLLQPKTLNSLEDFDDLLNQLSEEEMTNLESEIETLLNNMDMDKNNGKD